MKIAFTTYGGDLNGDLDPRFGRAARFLIFDSGSRTFEVADNAQNQNAAQGAGIQSAQAVAGLGVQAVVTGHCGPKAFRVLSAAGIRVYNTDIASVAEALRAFEAGELKEADGADVQGHW